LHWEIGNAFSAMLKRQRITPEQAKTAVEIYGQILLRSCLKTPDAAKRQPEGSQTCNVWQTMR